MKLVKNPGNRFGRSTLSERSVSMGSVSGRNDSDSGFIPLETIHRRVAKIKNRWTHEIAQARATEGQRRRQELETLLAQFPDTLERDAQSGENPLDAPGLSLVG